MENMKAKDIILENGFYFSDVSFLKEEDPECWQEIKNALDASDRLILIEDAFVLEAIVSPDWWEGSWWTYTLKLLDDLFVNYVIGDDKFGESFVVFDINELN